MLSQMVNIANWLIGEVGSAASRHKARALAFIQAASARFALRKEQEDKDK